MRKKLAILGLSLPLIFAGVACDDAATNNQECGPIDSDDCRVGPGDGNDEFGPGR